MSRYHKSRKKSAPRRQHQTRQVMQSLSESDGLPLYGALDAEGINELLKKEKALFGQAEDAIYTPIIVLWVWIFQCLSKEKSCQAAVWRLINAASELALPKTPSSNTGCYCNNRQKIPVPVLLDLIRQQGAKLERQAPQEWLWWGKHVYLIDGSTVLLADTDENQAAYPQQQGQAKGCGFPIIRIVVVFSLATASVCGVAWAPYTGKGTGEATLARKLLDLFDKGDVLVGDSIYCNYWLIALAKLRGVDVLFHYNFGRKLSFRTGERLGHKDHIATWRKPSKQPDWMDEWTYVSLPDTLRVREFYHPLHAKGRRKQSVTIATTLLDAREFPKEDLTFLYGLRWHAELNLRSLKTTMRMNRLVAQTPEMAERELLMHLLAYNIVRRIICQAAFQAGLSPLNISFSNAAQMLTESRQKLVSCTPEELVMLMRCYLTEVAKKEVGNRPGRIEPRRKKWRGTNYKPLQEPRAIARQRELRS